MHGVLSLPFPSPWYYCSPPLLPRNPALVVRSRSNSLGDFPRNKWCPRVAELQEPLDNTLRQIAGVSVQGQELGWMVPVDPLQHRIFHDRHLVGDDKEKGVADLIPW